MFLIDVLCALWQLFCGIFLQPKRLPTRVQECAVISGTTVWVAPSALATSTTEQPAILLLSQRDWSYSLDRVSTVTVYRGLFPTNDELCASLALALARVPCFAGRLQPHNSADWPVVCDWRGTHGVPVTTALALGISVDALLALISAPAGMAADQAPLAAFAPAIATGAALASLASPPLFAVRVTRLADGCVLGVAASHVLCDGVGFFLFMQTWAALHKNTPSPVTSVVRPLICATPASWYSWVCGALLARLRANQSQRSLATNLGLFAVHVPRVTIARLKAASATTTLAAVSTNDVLAAAIAHALGADALAVAVNLRRVPNSAIAPSFVGNAVGSVCVLPPLSAHAMHEAVRAPFVAGAALAPLLHTYSRGRTLVRVVSWVGLTTPAHLSFCVGGSPESLPVLHRPAMAASALTGHASDARHVVVCPASDGDGVDLMCVLTLTQAEMLAEAML